jgi:hypothetical protein
MIDFSTRKIFAGLPNHRKIVHRFDWLSIRCIISQSTTEFQVQSVQATWKSWNKTRSILSYAFIIAVWKEVRIAVVLHAISIEVYRILICVDSDRGLQSLWWQGSPKTTNPSSPVWIWLEHQFSLQISSCPAPVLRTFTGCVKRCTDLTWLE